MVEKVREPNLDYLGVLRASLIESEYEGLDPKTWDGVNFLKKESWRERVAGKVFCAVAAGGVYAITGAPLPLVAFATVCGYLVGAAIDRKVRR